MSKRYELYVVNDDVGLMTVYNAGSLSEAKQAQKMFTSAFIDVWECWTDSHGRPAKRFLHRCGAHPCYVD